MKAAYLFGLSLVLFVPTPMVAKAVEEPSNEEQAKQARRSIEKECTRKQSDQSTTVTFEGDTLVLRTSYASNGVLTSKSTTRIPVNDLDPNEVDVINEKTLGIIIMVGTKGKKKTISEVTEYPQKQETKKRQKDGALLSTRDRDSAERVAKALHRLIHLAAVKPKAAGD